MQAVLALLSLYSSILFPVVIVATWMFALYAALSYAVPNKLWQQRSTQQCGAHVSAMWRLALRALWAPAMHELPFGRSSGYGTRLWELRVQS